MTLEYEMRPGYGTRPTIRYAASRNNGGALYLVQCLFFLVHLSDFNGQF